MEKPDIRPNRAKSDLAGNEGKTTWVEGHNCVYHAESSVAKYRVSIKTGGKWKSYGFFNDLETAAYVANVAILVENCEEQYELNSVGDKNRSELAKWRNFEGNREKENLARNKFTGIQKALEAFREEDERNRKKREILSLKLAKALKEKADKEREQIEKEQAERDRKEAALIAKTPTAILLQLLERDIPSSQYRQIREEIQTRRARRQAT